ncbi:MAG: polyphenol oxidase family protein [Elusimicrobia bacterium]|nr:polyphenol oxidase family protein [Elusimicrobiota bacterium]MBU2613962.1 polyphenol oxidase family protein [Elusimicrobiota bacterium]
MWKTEGNLAFSTLISCFDSRITHFTTTKLSGNITHPLLTSSKQVHDKKIKIVKSISDAHSYEGYDGFITGVKGIPLGIFTADCVSVFLAEKSGKCAAILHAGWKGLYTGIIENGVEMLLENFGVESSGLVAAIGPHICEKCYEVGEEFAGYFPNSYKNGYLNLSNEAILRLKAKNIPENNIDCIDSKDFCTLHNPNLFFSYRQGEKTSRMLSLIMLK